MYVDAINSTERTLAPTPLQILYSLPLVASIGLNFYTRSYITYSIICISSVIEKRDL
jgi:hypothetical protein